MYCSVFKVSVPGQMLWSTFNYPSNFSDCTKLDTAGRATLSGPGQRRCCRPRTTPGSLCSCSTFRVLWHSPCEEVWKSMPTEVRRRVCQLISWRRRTKRLAFLWIQMRKLLTAVISHIKYSYGKNEYASAIMLSNLINNGYRPVLVCMVESSIENVFRINEFIAF